MPATHFDTIIIGSGFGGSVAAFRLAQAGKHVCLLERGKSYPPGSFARSPRALAENVWDPSKGRHGLFNIWSFRNIDSVVSSGLGGGSLIYANVLLRKDEAWFTQRKPDGTGHETWPVTRRDLDRHYDAVESMMAVQKFPFGAPGYEKVSKTQAMKDAAEKLGIEWNLPNLAVSFANPGEAPHPGVPLAASAFPNIHGRPRLTCRLCGECDLGCNDGAKNTLDHTYLSGALSYGAEIRTRSEVRHIAPMSEGYEIAYVEHLEENEGRSIPTQRLPLKRLTASKVVVAAGALGSTYLLLKNRPSLGNLGPALGTRFCGNGDVLSFAVNAERGGNAHWLNASHGPVITSFMRMADEFDAEPGDGPGYYIEDAGYPAFAEWLLEVSQVPGVATRLKRFAWRALLRMFGPLKSTDIGAEVGRLIGEGRLSGSSLPLLGMGRDVPDGQMRLDGNYLKIDWSDQRSRPYLDRIHQTMAGIAGTWNAKHVANPTSLLRRLITVHPLGGCPMSGDAAAGVVNSFGESFGHPSLYVADGSVMPGPVGANPALTIAAFSDRMCDHILDNWSSGRQPGHRYAATASVVPTRLEFSEVMAGFVATSETDFEVAARKGERQGNALTVQLTVEMDDIERFIADPEHTGKIGGTIACELIGGVRPVEHGIFNLFTASANPGATEMRYRLFSHDDKDRPVTVAGFKTVRNDPGVDMWQDTTTLYTRIFDGHVQAGGEAAAKVLATGIIRISIQDFMRQLTTFKARGPDRMSEAKAYAAFGKLFMGELWATYGRPVVLGSGR